MHCPFTGERLIAVRAIRPDLTILHVQRADPDFFYLNDGKGHFTAVNWGQFFRDEDGRTVRLAELITGPTIIIPVYYGCTNVCSILQGGMASALQRVQRKPGGEYRVLSVSFDETETPQLAERYKRTYLTAMNAPFPEDGWHFLTGSVEEVRRVCRLFGESHVQLPLLIS